ncbi:ABC transporter permease [Paenibacillus sp. FSL W8-0186]|uniref:Transport permease YfiM n=1 Tax=Paenibacillus woosongensis TaxID=307580 RepID=A0ABQ4MTP4_9BACL|nr:ABC transporter permease [Paenibacillus woosongensis]GIP59286.1 putative transport permease YfiM [Paenibacillus woosongensis]
MIPFLKKDLLVFWRDKKALAVSLVMPLILIAVLGFALPGWIENPAKLLEMKVALVNLDDEAAAVQQIQSELGSDPGTEWMSPIQALTGLLQSEEVRSFVHLQELSSEEARRQLEEEQIEAIITIPDGFSLGAFHKMLLNEGDGAEVQVTAREASLQVDVLKEWITGLMHSMNFHAALQHAGGQEVAAAAAVVLAEGDALGGREIIPGAETVTSFQYFALAVSIVFALLLSTTSSTKASAEKREQTLQRILLTGSHPMKYLSGKMSSTFCFSMLQFAVVILVSHLALGIFPGRSLHFWLGMFCVLVFLSLCVGALAALFTALVFRLEDSVASGLSFLVILIAGTIGGSFAPIYVLPGWLKAAGEWTPNGLSLAVLLDWLQTETNASLTLPLIKLGTFALAAAGLAIWLFPRRGRI